MFLTLRIQIDSALALSHARQLFEFADNYRGAYTGGIPDAANYYNSWSGYQDELIWAAAWLAKVFFPSQFKIMTSIFMFLYRSSHTVNRETYTGH